MLDKETYGKIEDILEKRASEALKSLEGKSMLPFDQKDVREAIVLGWELKKEKENEQRLKEDNVREGKRVKREERNIRLQKLLIGVQIALFLAAFVAAVATICYTRETRRLRIQAEEQMRIAVEPYLSVMVLSFNDTTWMKVSNSIKAIYGGEREDEDLYALRDKIDNEGVSLQYGCQVVNKSDNITDHEKIYIYDRETKKFIPCWTNWNMRRAEYSKLYYAFNNRSISRLELEREIVENYSKERKFISKCMTSDDSSSFVIVLFRDSQGRAYCWKKWFISDDQGMTNYKDEKRFWVGQG